MNEVTAVGRGPVSLHVVRRGRWAREATAVAGEPVFLWAVRRERCAGMVAAGRRRARLSVRRTAWAVGAGMSEATAVVGWPVFLYVVRRGRWARA